MPKAKPARRPLRISGFFSERKKKRRKTPLKTMLAGWDIMVADMSRSQIETDPRMAARIPVRRPWISSPRKKRSRMVSPPRIGLISQGARIRTPRARIEAFQPAFCPTG